MNNVRSIKALHLTLISMTLLSASSFAQTKLQKTGFHAEIASSVGFDDNILRTSEEFEREDEFLRIKPELNLTGVYGKHKFESDYDGEYVLYNKFSEVNYNDHRFALKATLDHSYRFNSIITTGYRRLHEEPGDTDFIFNNFTEFNLYDDYYGEYKLEYGQDNSKGKLVFGYKVTDIDYRNNNQDFRDRIENRFLAQFYYRLSSKSRLILEAINTTADHEPTIGQFERDNTTQTYRVGVDWDVTGLVSGEIKIGYQDRDFDVAQAIDFEGLNYEAEVEWKPLNYSLWKFSARRSSLNSTIDSTGSFVRNRFAVEVDHNLTERTKLYTSVSYTDDELFSLFGREDESLKATVSLNHELNRLLSVGLNIGYEDRSSDLALADYTSRSITATMKVTLD